MPGRIALDYTHPEVPDHPIGECRAYPADGTMHLSGGMEE